MLHRSYILVVGLSGIAGLLLLSATMATESGGGRSREVEGPAVGPAGQTGELRYLENPAHPFTGDFEMFGPYRLLPPHTQYILRAYPDEPKSSKFSETSTISALAAADIFVAPPADFEIVSARGVLRDGSPESIWMVWQGSAGRQVYASIGRAADWRLPLDVYLYPEDSLLQIEPTYIAGREAIVVQPRSGPAPNVGHVAIFTGVAELALSSPDLGQDALIEIAAQLVDGQ